MWKQVWLMTRVSLRNVGGWNRVKYGKDKKQKNRLLLLSGCYALLGFLIAGYAGALTYGLAALGMADAVPAYVVAMLSLIVLFFSMFTAGSVIFDGKTYELLAALPVPPAAIVISRFLVMYLGNLLLGLVVAVPAAAVYGLTVKPGIWFYPAMLLGTALAPLLPMAIATAAGAAVAVISSRMKHKNLIAAALTIALTIGIMAAVMAPASGQMEITPDMLRDLAGTLKEQIYALYPPARLFSEGITGGSPVSFLLFALLSVGAFVVMTVLAQRRFSAICAAMRSGGGGGRYRPGQTRRRSVLSALYRKEMSRYFASSLWVTNTAVGPAMMILLAVGLLLAGPDTIEGMLKLPESYRGMFGRLLPFLLAFLCSFSSTTVSAVSMEGKSWWLSQSLPVTSRQVFDAKMLVNLTMQLPCLAAADALLLFGGAVGGQEAVWLAVLPVLYVFFATVLGITVNCKLPNFQWESEAAVVKQSGAMFAAMLVGTVSVLAPMAAAALLQGASYHGAMLAVGLALAAATVLLYRKNLRADVRTIQ